MNQWTNETISLPASFNQKLFVAADDRRLGLLNPTHARAARAFGEVTAKFFQRNFIADGIGFDVPIREVSDIPRQAKLVRHALGKKAVTHALNPSRYDVLLRDFHRACFARTFAGPAGLWVMSP